ncbi:DUF6318 family protein [Paeniglutamicibacter psychrophenolicus]|uniref:DUF6318 family protein n=1 Tax=Paeniglutamicibacter psychrophenolicus TaxID=257454 RepID=UPI002784EE9A|nr:DUF6318 family protein [Paeniglutamicibacter psychrophenolicus]MDQ0094284.1 hypothetical protein [Paeniglutamicibacter psychrophenolicus]
MFAKFKKVMLVFCSGALVLTAAGCAGNAEPVEPTKSHPTPTTTATSSPPTPSPTPTAKPTPTPVPGSSKGPAKNWPVPKMPDAAKERTEAGIISFTEHWFDVLEYMYVTNETEQLKEITRPQCIECAENFIDPADGLANSGAWSMGGRLDAKVTLAVVTDSKSGLANFRLDREDLLIYDRNGEYNGKLPGTAKADVGALVLEYSDGWKVVNLQWLDSK